MVIVRADEPGFYKMVSRIILVRYGHEHQRKTMTGIGNTLDALLKEYTHRYGKHHATERLRNILFMPPLNIDREAPSTDPPQCAGLL